MGGLDNWLKDAFYEKNIPLDSSISSPFDIELSDIENDKLSTINNNEIVYKGWRDIVIIGSSLEYSLIH